MKLSISVASAAAVAACLFSANASASPAASPAREPVSVRVSGVGLDLTSDAGQRAFQRRVRSAIMVACAPHGSDLAALADSHRCRDEMIADASPKIAAILGRPGMQLASIGTGH